MIGSRSLFSFRGLVRILILTIRFCNADVKDISIPTSSLVECEGKKGIWFDDVDHMLLEEGEANTNDKALQFFFK